MSTPEKPTPQPDPEEGRMVAIARITCPSCEAAYGPDAQATRDNLMHTESGVPLGPLAVCSRCGAPYVTPGEGRPPVPLTLEKIVELPIDEIGAVLATAVLKVVTRPAYERLAKAGHGAMPTPDLAAWQRFLEDVWVRLHVLTGYLPVVLVAAPVVQRTDDSAAMDMNGSPVLVVGPCKIPDRMIARLLWRAYREVKAGRVRWTPDDGQSGRA